MSDTKLNPDQTDENTSQGRPEEPIGEDLDAADEEEKIDEPGIDDRSV